MAARRRSEHRAASETTDSAASESAASGSEADRGEAIRLGGVIQQIVRAPLRRTARVGDKVHHANDDGELVVDRADNMAASRVDTHDGGEGVVVPIRVIVPGSALADEGRITKGGWGELVEQSHGKLPSDFAPAFEEARLEVVELAVDRPIEIYGEVGKREFADDGGLRDAPSHRVTLVRALVVATGDDRMARVDREIARRYPPARRRADEPSRFAKWRAARQAAEQDSRRKEPASRLYRQDALTRWSFYLVAVAAAVFGYFAVTRRSSSFAVWTYACAVHLVLFRPLPPLSPFRMLERRYGRARHVPEHGILLLLICYDMMVLTSPLWEMGTLGVLIAATSALAIAVLLGLLGLPTYWLVVNVLFARPWDGSAGVHACIEGIVKDPTPTRVGKREVAIGSGTGYEEGFGSNADKELWQRFHGDGTFLVKTERGSVEVSPQQVVWATSVTGKDEDVKGPADYEAYEIIPVGGRIIAAGWIEKLGKGGIPKLRAKGTSPAIVVATGPQGEPRDWLRRLLVAHVVSTVLVVAMAAIGVMLFAWVRA